MDACPPPASADVDVDVVVDVFEDADADADEDVDVDVDAAAVDDVPWMDDVLVHARGAEDARGDSLHFDQFQDEVHRGHSWVAVW